MALCLLHYPIIILLHYPRALCLLHYPTNILLHYPISLCLLHYPIIISLHYPISLCLLHYPIISYTVSFHNFKSNNFKLSVSNPKNKHVAYVSVLSQISSCQGLGRENKLDILKTDRRSPASIYVYMLIYDYIITTTIIIVGIIILKTDRSGRGRLPVPSLTLSNYWFIQLY